MKLRLFVAAEANRPGHHLTRLTVTLVHSCQPAATPSATLRPPGLASPTPTARPGSATATPVPAGDECTAVSPHPEGTRLAQIYSVSYAEIMAWFCSGFGFGEIDVAYSLSRQTGAPVADIFAMRRDGLGWGEIMQALGIVPGGGPPTGVPANPGADPTEEASGPPPWVTPGNPSGTPDPTGEAGSGPPVVPPGPSMTPPTPPGPPANPGPP